MMTDEEIRRRVANGTTTEPDELAVLYNDGKTALVRRAKSSFKGRHVPACVERYDLENPHKLLGVWVGEEVWNCGKDENGRLTAGRLIGLVESLGLDVKSIRAAGAAAIVARR
jgi:hypothetical protein